MKRLAKTDRGRGGFSMVEVIVSLVLICMVMGGAYRVIVAAQSLSRSSRNRYVAVTLCKNRLERAENFDYEDLHILEEVSVVVNDNGYPDVNGFFSRTTTVNTNYLPDETMVSVNVKVRNKKTGGFGPMFEQMDKSFTEELLPFVP